MANMFNEDGTYNKTEWKAGDKITAAKLNKIELSLEAINNNDIDRHVEADSRLDILEERIANTPDNEQMDALEDMVKDNKDAADLAVYGINQKIESLESVNAGSRLDALEKSIENSATKNELKTLETSMDQEVDTLEHRIDAIEQRMIILSPSGGNDTVFLKNAIDSLYEGGTVKLLEGTFILDYIEVSNRVDIEGSGNATILKINECSENFIYLKNGYTAMFRISNLYIDGNKTNNTCKNVIYLEKNTLPNDLELFDLHAKIDRVTIRDAYGNGIYLGKNARETKIANSVIYNCGGDGILCVTSDSDISNITLFLNEGSGIRENGSANRYSNIKSFMNKQYGFYVKSNATTFSQCEAQENYLNGWIFDGSMLIIGDGLISSTNSIGNVNNLSGFKLVNCDSLNLNVIANNFRKIDGLNPQKYGVEIDATTSRSNFEMMVSGHDPDCAFKNESASSNMNRIIVNGEDKTTFTVKEYKNLGGEIPAQSNIILVVDFDGARDEDVFLAQPLFGLNEGIIWTAYLAEKNKVAIRIYNQSTTVYNVYRTWKIIKFNM